MKNVKEKEIKDRGALKKFSLEKVNALTEKIRIYRLGSEREWMS